MNGQCNGYGDAPDPKAKYPWQFVACAGCDACAHLPRCRLCVCTARNGHGECLTHADERRKHSQAAEADRLTSALHILAERIAAGTHYDCATCGDGLVTDTCTACCPHTGGHDHLHCLDCGLDRTDNYVSEAEYRFEGDR